MTSTGTNLIYSDYKNHESSLPNLSSKIEDPIFNQPSSSTSSTISSGTTFISERKMTPPAYGQVRISPVFDAHFGLPTASIAEIAFDSASSSSNKEENFYPIASLTSGFNPPNNALTSRSSLISDSDEFPKNLTSKNVEKAASSSNSSTSNTIKLLPNNQIRVGSPKLNFIGQNFENLNTAHLNASSIFENDNCTTNPSCSRMNLTTIYPTSSNSYGTNSMESTTSISNSANLDVVTLASAIIAAANVANQNRIHNEELANVLSTHGYPTNNQTLGLSGENFYSSLEELIKAQELIRTSINVHQILGQSIANANSNNLFKSATTTMASSLAVAESSPTHTSAPTFYSTSSSNKNVQGVSTESNNNNSKTDISNTKTNNPVVESSDSTTSAFRPLMGAERQKTISDDSKIEGIQNSATDTTKPLKSTATKSKNSQAMSNKKLGDVPTSSGNNCSGNGGQLSSFDDFVTTALDSLVSTPSSNENGDVDASTTKMSLFNNNIDGSTSYLSSDGKGVLLCQVCSDRASGFHYGINSCEGCKGFFRRSIQQKIHYKPCTKSQQCSIVRANRNRCQDCRFQKCLSVGMSRDAVRFGRVPKREKVKIAEELQRASMRSQMDALTGELEDEAALISSIEKGFTEFGVELRTICEQYIEDADFQNETVYFQLINAVVKFSKQIRGFNLLYKKDCVHLLKSSIFQILLLRFSTLKVQNIYSTFAGHHLYDSTKLEEKYFIDALKIPQFMLISNEATAVDSEKEQHYNNMSLFMSTVEFINRFRLLSLDDRQLAIFSALVLCQPDSAGGGLLSTSTHMQQAPLLKMLQQKLWVIFQSVLFPNPPLNAVTGSLLNQSLFAALADLRALNTSHQEHLQKLAVNLVPPTNNKDDQIGTQQSGNVPTTDDPLPTTVNHVRGNEKLEEKHLNSLSFNNFVTPFKRNAVLQQQQSGKTTAGAAKPEDFNGQDRKRSSSSPPLPIKQKYNLSNHQPLYNATPQKGLNPYQALAVTSSASLASQQNLLTTLATVSTPKSLETSAKINNELKCEESQNETITFPIGELPTLRRVLEQPQTLLPPPAKKPCRIEDLYMSKILNGFSNYVPLRDSHKEIASLLEGPSASTFLLQQQNISLVPTPTQQQQQLKLQPNQQIVANRIIPSSPSLTINSQQQKSNSTNANTSVIASLLNSTAIGANNNSAANTNMTLNMSLMQNLGTNSFIIDQFRQQLAQQVSQNKFDANYDSRQTHSVSSNSSNNIANGVSNSSVHLKNEIIANSHNNANSSQTSDDEPLNLCIREQ